MTYDDCCILLQMDQVTKTQAKADSVNNFVIRPVSANDHTIGYKTSNSASTLRFHHLSLLALLVAVVLHSSNFHHWPLLVALVLH